jgi:cell division transport system permease protein
MSTIALSVFIVSASGLFFLNADDLMDQWKKGVRIMVYLTQDTTEAERLALNDSMLGLYGVASTRFISKTEALNLLKKQMTQQSSLLSNLAENPLPHAYEIRMMDSSQDNEAIETLADHLRALPLIDDVEYGQRWLGRFAHVFALFRIAGYAVSCLFSMAAAFIVANTIRLVLYSRREEVEIMRLVGATDAFIRGPFYMVGLIQGTIGGIIGLSALFVVFLLMSANLSQGFSSVSIDIRFFDIGTTALIILASMVIGWLGCHLSLRQFLKA